MSLIDLLKFGLLGRTMGLRQKNSILGSLAVPCSELCYSEGLLQPADVHQKLKLALIGSEVNDRWMSNMQLMGLPKLYEPMIRGYDTCVKIVQDGKWPDDPVGIESALVECFSQTTLISRQPLCNVGTLCPCVVECHCYCLCKHCQ